MDILDGIEALEPRLQEEISQAVDAAIYKSVLLNAPGVVSTVRLLLDMGEGPSDITLRMNLPPHKNRILEAVISHISRETRS